MPEVRTATGKDLAAIFDLYEGWLAEEPAVGMVKAPPGYFETRLGPHFWVAEEDGKLVGFACGSVHTTEAEHAVIPAGEKYLEIDELYVRPEHRNQGLGSSLVQHLIDDAVSSGAARTLVYSSSKQWKKVVEFYERQGFDMWFVRMVR
jgi:GNAT superfamily N-acetyltransferase